MKHVRSFLVTVLILCAALSAGAQEWDPDAEGIIGELEHVMMEFQAAMRTMDAGHLADLYWEDAMRIFSFPNGGREVVEGRDPIMGRQEDDFRWIRREDPEAMRRFTLPEPDIHFRPDGLPLFIYRDEDAGSVQIFHFEERLHRFAISRHVEIVFGLEPMEATETTSWTDENQNGILEPEEQNLAINNYLSIAQGSRAARSALDYLYDWDGNLYIDEAESARAVAGLYRDALRQGYRFFPEFTEGFVDVDRSGFVSVDEAGMALAVAFDLASEVPRPVNNPVDERMDVDMDGWIIGPEAAVFLRALTRSVAMVPHYPITNPTTPADVQFVVYWADANENGLLEGPEIADLGVLLLRLTSVTEIVSTPLELFYDRDRDFMISDEERIAVNDEIAHLLSPETEEVIRVFNNVWRTDSGLRVSGDIEDAMDNDPRDGMIEHHEAVAALEAQYTEVAALWLQEHGSEDIRMLISDDRGFPEPDGSDQVLKPQPDPHAGDAEDTNTPDPGTTPDVTDPKLQSVATVTTANRPAPPADQVGDELSLAVQLRPVYPVLRKHYDTAPLGSLTLSNVSSADLTDLEVTLSLASYIDQARTYDEIESLAAGESVSMDLTLLFNSTVLEITEGDRLDATVTVSYTGAGGSAQESATETMIFYDRNAIRWDDTRKVAAFVTERDEEIRSYARRAIAGSRDERNDAVDDALQDAMVLFVAMVESDLMYFRDPDSTYASASASGATIDYMQFPRQTLTDFGGDCDDLSVCYNALLESVGRRTAFITVPGHIMPAVALNMTASEARSAFMDPTDLIFDEDDNVWVPVEITALEDSFYEAWQDAARSYRQYSSSGQAQVIATATAWDVYESVASVVDDEVESPNTDDVEEEFADALAEFVNTQIASRELQLQADLTEDPGDRRLLNRLGVLYAQYGMWDRARTQFELIVESEDYIPALLNLGHISFLDEEYRTAATYYDRVLVIQADHPNALLASARANHELENYGNVRAAYEQLRVLSPRLAADYSYLDLSSSNDAARAQAASDLSGSVIWELSEEDGTEE